MSRPILLHRLRYSRGEEAVLHCHATEPAIIEAEGQLVACRAAGQRWKLLPAAETFKLARRWHAPKYEKPAHCLSKEQRKEHRAAHNKERKAFQEEVQKLGMGFARLPLIQRGKLLEPKPLSAPVETQPEAALPLAYVPPVPGCVSVVFLPASVYQAHREALTGLCIGFWFETEETASGAVTEAMLAAILKLAREHGWTADVIVKPVPESPAKMLADRIERATPDELFDLHNEIACEVRNKAITAKQGQELLSACAIRGELLEQDGHQELEPLEEEQPTRLDSEVTMEVFHSRVLQCPSAGRLRELGFEVRAAREAKQLTEEHADSLLRSIEAGVQAFEKRPPVVKPRTKNKPTKPVEASTETPESPRGDAVDAQPEPQTEPHSDGYYAIRTAIAAATSLRGLTKVGKQLATAREGQLSETEAARLDTLYDEALVRVGSRRKGRAA